MTSKRLVLTTSLVTTSWLMGSHAAIAQTVMANSDDGATVAIAAEPLPEVPAAVVEVAPVSVAPAEVMPASKPESASPVKAAPAEPPPIKATQTNSTPTKATPEPLVVESAEVFIDGNDYSLGATERESVPVEIITRNQPPNKQTVTQSVSAIRNSRPTSVQIGAVNLSSGGIGLNAQAAAAPVSSSIVSPGKAYFDRKFLQPLGTASQNLLRMVFPVAVPAPITSLFGWRIHPIAGTQRLHTGTDIGAPMGTPVMAAMPGRVILADEMGGYGITVAIEHDNGVRQTLYAHMSEIFVRPGDTVQQGTVIGRIGSTGASTGPHLHFELRQMMPDGTWVALDAGRHLEHSMGNLVRSLQLAKQQKAERTTALRTTASPGN